MKRATLLLPFFVVGCMGTPTTGDVGPAERCGASDCFNQRDVREFDVIDRDTVVVYVGAQRCPFLVELEQAFCNLSVAPGIAFLQTVLGSPDRLTPMETARICATTRGLVLYSGILSPGMLGQRDMGLPGQRRGGFPDTGGPIGRSSPLERSFPVEPGSTDVCRVTDVRSINDEQLIELLAETQAAPPPPIGEGQLEVPDEAEEGIAAEEAPEEGAADAGVGGE
jgi:hypothetical protein